MTAITPALMPSQTFETFETEPPQLMSDDLLTMEVAPDIAIEMLSPTNTAYEMDEKSNDHWSAGVPPVWVVNPEARSVRIHRRGQPIAELCGGPVLPGFAVPVRELWPPVAAVANAVR